MFLRLVATAAVLASLTACARNDLAEAPVPLKDFGLGLNIAVADKVQMVPISRPAEPKDWEAAIQKAVDARFGAARYQGSKLYNIGIAVEAYALAPPGIPVVAAPKSVLVVTANIWDDAAQKKLNDEGFQITVFESLSGDTLIGSGLTRNKEQQMEALAFNVARRVEDWLKDHPEWFGMTKEELSAAIRAQNAAEKATAAAAKPATATKPAAAKSSFSAPSKVASKAAAKAADTAAVAPVAAPVAAAPAPAAAKPATKTVVIPAAATKVAATTVLPKPVAAGQTATATAEKTK